MKHFFPPVMLAVLAVVSCAPAGPSVKSRLNQIAAERDADNAVYAAGKLSSKEMLDRTGARLAQLRGIRAELNAEESGYRAGGSYHRPSYYTPPASYTSMPSAFTPSSSSVISPSYTGSSYGSAGSSTPSYASRSRYPSRVDENDYSVSKPLGGGIRITDRYGNSTVGEQTLGGGYRTTSDSGRSTTWNQNLNGGQTGRDSRGNTWTTGQSLNGNRQVHGSNGASYTRQQNLDGSYSWTKD